MCLPWPVVETFSLALNCYHRVSLVQFAPD